jgi:hypothetical protein
MVQKKAVPAALGEKNEAFGQYFIGQSYLATLSGGPSRPSM